MVFYGKKSYFRIQTAVGLLPKPPFFLKKY